MLLLPGAVAPEVESVSSGLFLRKWFPTIPMALDGLRRRAIVRVKDACDVLEIGNITWPPHPRCTGVISAKALQRYGRDRPRSVEK